MTIEIGTQKVGRIGRRRGGAPAPEQLPIGEVDANIFACPACSRPLGVGTSRCPSCRTRLVAGVKASRALAFVGLGVAVGMIASGGLMALTSAVPRPVDVAIASAPPIVTPSVAPIASAPGPVANPGIPSSALSALRQTALLNQRVVSDADRLTVALRASRPSVSEIAAILRAMASTSAFGTRLAPTVGDWDDAAAVSADLAAFYADIGRTAQDGLSASVLNDRAYIKAAERMLAIVAGLDDIDADSRTLAATVDIELPPLATTSR